MALNQDGRAQRPKPLGPMKLISGSCNTSLAHNVAEKLDIEPVPVNLQKLANTERSVEILANVRGCDVFVFQSLSAPVNDHIMELILLLDALRRASATRITAVMPYFAYGRHDRKERSRIPISAKAVANMISHAGADRVLSLDLHSEQTVGFFDVPVDLLYARNIFVQDILERKFENPVIVTPDVAGIARARQISKPCAADLVVVHRDNHLQHKTGGVVIGDVKGKECIIIDDIVDTGGTLSSASNALMEAGAKSVHAYATHGILSGGAVADLENSSVKDIVIADSVETQSKNLSDMFRVLSSVDLFAQAIDNIHAETSISALR